jgi:hypothetical protein
MRAGGGWFTETTKQTIAILSASLRLTIISRQSGQTSLTDHHRSSRIIVACPRGGGGGGGGRLATRIFFIYMHESLAFSQSVIDTYCVYPLPPAGQFSNVTETVKFTYKHKSKLISKYWKPPDISPRV